MSNQGVEGAGIVLASFFKALNRRCNFGEKEEVSTLAGEAKSNSVYSEPSICEYY